MERSRIATTLALVLAGSCTVVVPGGAGDGKMPNGGDGDGGVIQPPPPVKPVDADMLFVINLEQSAANLAPYYADGGDAVGIADALVSGLALVGVNVTHWAMIPTYPATGGVRLLDGGGSGSVASSAELQQLAVSGNYDGPGSVSEAEGIIPTGQDLVDASLPPELGGINGKAFFDQPRNLFVVVYLQPLARRCNLGDPQCQVAGRSPADVFTAQGADGTASWLQFASGGIPIKQVVHVAIATKEGESEDDFVARCSGINGFPKALLDVMEPSATSYFGPLLSALNAANPGTGQSADLCDLISELQRDTLIHPVLTQLVDSIAAMAGPAGSDGGP